MQDLEIYDCHIHLMPRDTEGPEIFRSKAKESGVSGGIIFSMPPETTVKWRGIEPMQWKDRVTHVLDFCSRLENFYPFLWIDPTLPNAVEQVEYAKNAGIKGFKVICNRYMPVEGLTAYRKMAELDMPLLFHSGILWEGGEPTANWNRPGNFECMLEVPRIRFALAHVSWPWTDECTALFGKFANTRIVNKDAAVMYIDSSPGAADFYRDDIFKKLVLNRYGIEDKLLFGIDRHANAYDVRWAKYIIDFDRKMFDRLQEQYGNYEGYMWEGLEKLSPEDRNPFRKTFRNAVKKNILEFLNVSGDENVLSKRA